MSNVLREHREILLVLATFIVLGIIYSTTTPLFEAPDEQWHFAFVQHVAAGRGLPVQTLGKPTHLARQEGSQPPLYYLLAAATTFWIDTSDYPGIVWENPHYGYNVPGIVNDNKNLFVHTALESFPYRGATLAIHIARWLSVLMGALGVWFTYLLTLEIFPDRKFLAASAGAFAGFVPQFLFVSSAVSNDSTIVAMSALSLWMTIRLFLVKPRLRDAVLLGAATGLAALAKVSGLGLFVLGLLVVMLCAWRSPAELGQSKIGNQKPVLSEAEGSKIRAIRAALFNLTLLTFIFLLVAGWWYARNWMLYGELTGTDMMVRIFGARDAPLTALQLIAQLREVWETFWVGFGWGNIRAHPTVYTSLQVLVALSIAGLLLGFFHRRDRFHVTLVKALPFFVLAFWIVVAFAELLHWMEITQAPHGRLFFPVLPAIAPLAVFGLTQWVPLRLQPFSARGAAALLFILAAVAPLTTLQPAYAYPAWLTANDVPNSLQRVDINYDGKMKLLGYDVTPRRAPPDDAVTLTLYWQSLAHMDDDYSIGIHLLDANQRVVGARDSYPGHGLLPTRLWSAGQFLRDPYWLPIAADAVPGVAQIQISLYTREDKRDLPALDPNGAAITPIIGQIKIASANPVAPRVQHATDFSFGKQIALIGYDLDLAWSHPERNVVEAQVRPERSGAESQDEPLQNLKLTLYLKRIATIANDYTVFAHILDAEGRIVVQRDQPPGNGNDPTSLWDDGEIVKDTYILTLPAGARGTYQIEVGLYNRDTGNRLPVTDGKGILLGDHVALTSFEVAR